MGGQVSRLTADTVAKNLRKPENTISGYFVGRFLKKRNAVLEHNAARLCNIQPNSQVLEVGFGPGIGLKSAYNYVKGGNGIIHGVDISDNMMKLAANELKTEISVGKVIIYPNSVTELPFDNDTIDSIFHCNCYYFWPDMDAATKELYRVIKHDGVIVAVRGPKTLKMIEKRGFMKYGNPDLKRYMDSLERSGFVDVKFEEGSDKKTGFKLETIIGTASKKVKDDK